MFSASEYEESAQTRESSLSSSVRAPSSAAAVGGYDPFGFAADDDHVEGWLQTHLPNSIPRQKSRAHNRTTTQSTL